MFGAFEHTLTWYAKTNTANVFVRTVVPYVMWQAQKVANTIKSGLIDSDKAIIWVPLLDDSGIDRSAILSFKIGDFLVPEIAAEEMVDASFTPSMLFAKYPRAVQVRSVDLKKYGPNAMWHYQIGGK